MLRHCRVADEQAAETSRLRSGLDRAGGRLQHQEPVQVCFHVIQLASARDTFAHVLGDLDTLFDRQLAIQIRDQSAAAGVDIGWH